MKPHAVACLDYAALGISLTTGAYPGLFIGGQDRKSEGRECMWGSWGGAETPSPPATLTDPTSIANKFNEYCTYIGLNLADKIPYISGSQLDYGI